MITVSRIEFPEGGQHEDVHRGTSLLQVFQGVVYLQDLLEISSFWTLREDNEEHEPVGAFLFHSLFASSSEARSYAVYGIFLTCKMRRMYSVPSL